MRPKKLQLYVALQVRQEILCLHNIDRTTSPQPISPTRHRASTAKDMVRITQEDRWVFRLSRAFGGSLPLSLFNRLVSRSGRCSCGDSELRVYIAVERE